MGSEIKSYRDLVAWQRAFAIGKQIYRISTRFPDAERFGLTSQIRRCDISMASNIAEGYGRGSTADYIRFLKVSRGSLYELDTQLLFALDFGYAEQREYDDTKASLDECERVLAGLIRSLESKSGT